MARLANLRAAKSLGDLAGLLQFTPSGLSYVLYGLPHDDKYTTFFIPKRRGGQRTIQSPNDKLRLAQRRLSDLLQDCVAEIEAAPGRTDRLTHGFKRGRSIITNARRHRRHRYVLNLDLENFFPTINFGRVRGFFIKNRDFLLHDSVATAIAQLACYDNALPQGSPCSPVISNLIAHTLDIHLLKLASAAHCTYTRYADDLSFSTNAKQFPATIAEQMTDGGDPTDVWAPSLKVRDTIERAGFRINETKTHMMYRHSRQEVTGLVVNEIVNVKATYRYTVRAMVHRLIATGQFQAYGQVEIDGRGVIAKRVGKLDELSGMLGFIHSVTAHLHKPTSPGSKDKLSADEKVYRDFLMYREFYAADSPVIICEGPTDNIYLKYAVRSMAAEFPLLANADRKPSQLNVKLYKHPRSKNTARIMGLISGGGAVLGNFIVSYLAHAKRFQAPGLLHPVIVLYDNDPGGRKVASAADHFMKGKASVDAPFVHVTKNLYLVPTPRLDGKDTKIEDFFDEDPGSWAPCQLR